MTKILFMGTPDFAVAILEKLIADHYEVIGVVTQPDRPKGRKKIMTPPPVKLCAQAYHLPVFQPEKIKEKEAYELILALNPDLIVTAAFGQILPQAILATPRYGCACLVTSGISRRCADSSCYFDWKTEIWSDHYVYGRGIGCRRYDCPSGDSNCRNRSYWNFI